MDDALELRAWRFLAAHRVGTLDVTHVTFIDGPLPCVTTPSTGQHYESSKADSFGEAAIKLAIKLGMPCAADESRESLTRVSACDRDSSSAPTASRRNGSTGRSSRRTEMGSAVSTTAATAAEQSIGGGSEQPEELGAK